MASLSGIRAGRAFIVIEAVDKTARTMNMIGQRLDKYAASFANTGRQLMQASAIALTP